MKEHLRQRLVRARAKLSAERVLGKSERIMKRLSSLPEFKKARKIMLYVSFGKEVFTHQLIKELLSRGRTVAVPLTLEKNKMIASQLKELRELERSARAFPEPKKEFARELPPEQLELVLVPAVAFAEDGSRLGRGYGFYDEFLKKLSKKASIIGLAFELQILKSLPMEEHDVRVHKIVTEKRVINCA